jgi:hypothetical protein
MLTQGTVVSRRGLLQGAALTLGGLAASHAFGATFRVTPALRPTLLQRALAARDRHATRIVARDTIAIADFDAPSGQPRFHLVDVSNGRITSFLVAHGRGSDPDHSGWLERFSNDPGSAASSAGAYVTGDIYQGKHGRSRRLSGLDATNSNAESRAIVVHAASYVSEDMLREHGKLGRSEGCFAVSQTDLDQVLSRLGAGHLIYADKV